MSLPKRRKLNDITVKHLTKRTSRQPSLTLDENDLYLEIDKLDALRQSIRRMLMTERFSQTIYDHRYGIEFQELVGEDSTLARIDIERRIIETLQEDDRVLRIHSFDTYETKGILHTRFIVDSVHGELMIDFSFDDRIDQAVPVIENQEGIVWRIKTQTIVIPYTTSFVRDPNTHLTYTRQKGQNGIQYGIYEAEYNNGTPTGEVRNTRYTISKEPVPEIIVQGTQQVEWVKRSDEQPIAPRQTIVEDDTIDFAESYVQNEGTPGVLSITWEEQLVNGRATGETRYKTTLVLTPPINEVYVQGTNDREWVTETRTVTVAFEKITIQDNDLLPEESVVEQVGINGSRTFEWTEEYVNGEPTGNKTPEVEITYTPPVDEIYRQGTKVVEWRTETKQEVVPFSTSQVESAEVYEGLTEVQVAGVNGYIRSNRTVQYVNGVKTTNTTPWTVIDSVDPIDEVIAIGTKNPIEVVVDTYEAPYPQVVGGANFIGFSAAGELLFRNVWNNIGGIQEVVITGQTPTNKVAGTVTVTADSWSRIDGQVMPLGLEVTGWPETYESAFEVVEFKITVDRRL